MLSVTIYTLPGCPYCEMAKAALDKEGLSYKEIVVRGALPRLPDGRTSYTFPQIFLGMGGFDNMRNWLPARAVKRGKGKGKGKGKK